LESRAAEGAASGPPPPDIREHLDTGLACLLILARYLEVPADGAPLRHEFGRPGEPFDDGEILRAAKALGIKARVVGSRWSRLAGLPLPAMALLKDGRYALLARAEAEKVHLHDPREPRPLALSREAFEAIWSGRLVLVATRSGGPGIQRQFGFAWFVPALVKYRRFLGEVLLASFFLQVFALLTPLFTQVIIDKVLVHKGFATLQVLAVGMLGLTLFEVVLGIVRAYVLAHTSSRIDVELGAAAFRHVLSLPLAYFEARRVGDTAARVRELETIRQFLTGSTVTLVLDVLFTFVFVGVMFFYSAALTGLVVGVLPLYVVLSAVLTPVFRSRLNDKFNRGAENHAFLIESVTGIQTVKALAVEPQLRRRWEEQLAGYVRASFRTVQLGNVAGQIGSLLSKGTTIAILFVGAHAVMRGELTVGELIAFNMLAGRVVNPVLRIVQLWQEFQQAGVSVRRLADLLNAPSEPASEAGRSVLPALAGQVRFEGVTFRYQLDRAPAVADLSFDIPAGRVVGIVGRSGSGKSTIAKLIQRLYVPEGGRVLVDGLDVSQLSPSWLRRQIGVVLQENFLFNRSIRENIALADGALPMDTVIRAARMAGAHDFIVGLPDGYDTVLGEHGCNLSGGQRQRIAIARALVTNPRILIFDEATSALDYESEEIIQQNLAEICKGRTVFIIAHRLSTVRMADEIFVIETGRIVEHGPHGQLLEQGGYYARLHSYQDRGARPASPRPAAAMSGGPPPVPASVRPKSRTVG
jgi:subfamily B ATP-binding cassette protein HlyB/CyaB